MSNTHSVWVHNTSPEWLAKNADVTDMVLASGLSRYNANFAAHRLKEYIPGGDFFLKDEHGNVVGLVPMEDAYDELIVKPRREACGLA